MATSASRNLATLLTMRFLLGTIESGVFPFCDYINSIFYSHDTIGTSLAEKSIWVNVVKAIMGPVGALFLYIGGSLSFIAEWRCLLLLDGVPALMTGALVLMVLPNSPVQCANFLTEKESRWYLQKIESTQKERERRSEDLTKRSSGGIRDVVILLRDVRIATCTAVLVVGLASLYGYIFFRCAAMGVTLSELVGGGSHSVRRD